jgi:hypothetical protein
VPYPMVYERAALGEAVECAFAQAKAEKETPRRRATRVSDRARQERLELYRARLYGGRARSEYRLREYQRAAEGASARLRGGHLGRGAPERLLWALSGPQN